MLELVLWNYWWPGLSRYVAKFIAGCNACNQMKTFPTQKVGKLIPNKVPDRCWQVISVDMIGELPDSKGYNAVLMVVDRLSKRIHAVDRKSTRLNSSHANISYAVFCLK